MAEQKRRNATAVIPILVVVLGLILLIVGIILLSQGGLSTSQVPASPTPQISATEPSSALAEPSYPEVKRVSLADARAAYEAKTAVIVDVRSSSAYADAHIPGALNIPLSDLPYRVKELDPNHWIITYCT